MSHNYHKPASGLEQYIRIVITIQNDIQPIDQKLPLFTNEMPALLCKIIMNKNSGNNTVKDLILFGRSINDEYLTVDNNEVVVMYLFKPFMLSCIFNISAKDLKDDEINLHDWEPKKNYALTLQLVHCKSLKEILNALDNFIIMQLENNEKVCYAVQYSTDEMMLDQSNEVLGRILKELKMNERTFQRVFKKYVGITANQYRRICMFHSAFHQLRKGEYEKLIDVAYENGYSDQSHYIRSFKEFTRTTPADYLKDGLENK